MKIVFRPLESIAETQPQLQPPLLRLSAMICQYFTAAILRLLFYTTQRQSDKRDGVQRAGNCRICSSNFLGLPEETARTSNQADPKK
jgi:hypothetical protein